MEELKQPCLNVKTVEACTRYGEARLAEGDKEKAATAFRFGCNKRNREPAICLRAANLQEELQNHPKSYSLFAAACRYGDTATCNDLPERAMKAGAGKHLKMQVRAYEMACEGGATQHCAQAEALAKQLAGEQSQ